MPATDLDWQRAYALQALSDLEARDIVANGGADKCHRLHFLQMAAEKVCKAYLVAANGHENVRKSHAYVASTLPLLARQFYGVAREAELQQWQVRAIRHFAQEIELLAPACDDGGTREDNSEYPWLNAGAEVQAPCRYNFPRIHDGDRTLVSVIHLLRKAATVYAR